MAVTGFWDDLLRRLRAQWQGWVDDARVDGYEDAAKVCLGVLEKAIDELQRRPGNMAKDDQAVLLRFRELRVDMIEALRVASSEPPGERDRPLLME